MNKPAEIDPVSQAITDILLAKDSKGERKYSPEEVRDFTVGCVFELDLDITPELQPVLLDFLSQFELPEDASDEALLETIRHYFVKYPLNPELMTAMNSFGRDQAMTGAKAPKDRGEQLAALRKIGKDDQLAAPEAKTGKAAPNVKRGLK